MATVDAELPMQLSVCSRSVSQSSSSGLGRHSARPSGKVQQALNNLHNISFGPQGQVVQSGFLGRESISEEAGFGTIMSPMNWSANIRCESQIHDCTCSRHSKLPHTCCFGCRWSFRHVLLINSIKLFRRRKLKKTSRVFLNIHRKDEYGESMGDYIWQLFLFLLAMIRFSVHSITSFVH